MFDFTDFSKAVEVFTRYIPAASLEAMRAGLAGQGCDAANKVAMTADLMDSRLLFLTGNTGTVYATAILDLEAWFDKTWIPNDFERLD